MKFLAILFNIILLFTATTNAQSNWEKMESLLWENLDKGKISSEEWHQSRIKQAGSLGGQLQVWFKEELKIENKFLEEHQILKSDGLQLVIPDEWEVVMENGNTSIKLFLINLESKAATIPRIDATVNNFYDFIKVEGKWYPIRENSKSSCGNSYTTSALGPNSFYFLEVSSIHQSSGSKEVQYKAALDYEGKRIESNEINVKLFPNQIKRLVEEGVI